MTPDAATVEAGLTVSIPGLRLFVAGRFEATASTLERRTLLLGLAGELLRYGGWHPLYEICVDETADGIACGPIPDGVLLFRPRET